MRESICVREIERCERRGAAVRRHPQVSLTQLSSSYISSAISHRYLEEFPEGGLFKGKNFVFDQRVAISSTNPTIVGRCLGCDEPFDEISGSRVCTVCRDLVLVCPRCSDSLLEYHCATHQPWAQHYFTPAELQRGGAESAARGVAETVGRLKGKEETEADAAQTDGKGQKGNFYTRRAGRSATQCNAKVPDMREGIVAMRRSLLWILAA